MFKPTLPTYHIGLFSIKGQLTDSRLTLPFKFNVIVTNDAPIFKEFPENQRVELNTIKEYKLPDIIELEKLPVSIKITRGPNFASIVGTSI
jgi:hypothetical protein